MELQKNPKPNSDYSAKLYQAKTANVQQRYAKQLLDLAGIKEGDRVLDIGCGCGNLVGIIASIVGPHVRGVFKTPSNIYDGAFLRKQLTSFSSFRKILHHRRFTGFKILLCI